MIDCVAGKGGGGKSYMIMERAMKYLAMGGIFCTNIPIKKEGVRKYLESEYGWELQDAQLIHWKDNDVETICNFHEHVPEGEREKPTWVVIDEAHVYLNNRNWKLNGNKAEALFQFLTHARHYHVDVTFLSQHMKNVDTQVMRQVLQQWECKDLSRLQFGWVKWPPFVWNMVRIQYDYESKYKLSRKFFFKDKKIFTLYDSHNHIEGIETMEHRDIKATPKTIAMRKKRKKKQIIYYGALGLVSTLLVACGGSFKFGNEPSEPEIVYVDRPEPNQSRDYYMEGDWKVYEKLTYIYSVNRSDDGPLRIAMYGDRVHREVGRTYRYGKLIGASPQELIFSDSRNKVIWRFTHSEMFLQMPLLEPPVPPTFPPAGVVSQRS